ICDHLQGEPLARPGADPRLPLRLDDGPSLLTDEPPDAAGSPGIGRVAVDLGFVPGAEVAPLGGVWLLPDLAEGPAVPILADPGFDPEIEVLVPVLVGEKKSLDRLAHEDTVLDLPATRGGWVCLPPGKILAVEQLHPAVLVRARRCGGGRLVAQNGADAHEVA